jgi:hypothetical protein
VSKITTRSFSLVVLLGAAIALILLESLPAVSVGGPITMVFQASPECPPRLEAADAQGRVRRRVRLRASENRAAAAAAAALCVPAILTDVEITSAVLILLAIVSVVRVNPALTGPATE